MAWQCWADGILNFKCCRAPVEEPASQVLDPEFQDDLIKVNDRGDMAIVNQPCRRSRVTESPAVPAVAQPPPAPTLTEPPPAPKLTEEQFNSERVRLRHLIAAFRQRAGPGAGMPVTCLGQWADSRRSGVLHVDGALQCFWIASAEDPEKVIHPPVAFAALMSAQQLRKADDDADECFPEVVETLQEEADRALVVLYKVNADDISESSSKTWQMILMVATADEAGELVECLSVMGIYARSLAGANARPA